MPFTSGYKLNANTDYEFTVSNETIAEIVSNEGIDDSNISEYCFAALIDTRIYTLRPSTSIYMSDPNFDGWISDECVFGLYRNITIPFMNKDLTTTNTPVYERNFLIWNGTIYPNTPNEKSGDFLVMDIKDIKKWYMDFNTGCFSATSVTSMTPSGGPRTGYTGNCYLYSDNLGAPTIRADEQGHTEGLNVRNIFVYKDENWVGSLNPSSHGRANTFECRNNWAGGESYTRGYLNTTDTTKLYQRGVLEWAALPKLPDVEFPNAAGFDFNAYPDTIDGILIDVSCAASVCNSYSCIHPLDLDTILTWQSWAGLKFKYSDTYYKPIIEQGVIVGYSDDMTTPSEYDTMTNVTGNNISPTPPEPPEPDAQDNEIDVNMQQFAPTQCFVNYIEMSTENMIKLASGFNAYNASIWNLGGDLMKNLISYKIFSVYGTHSGTIKNVSIGGHEIEYDNAPISGNYIDDMGTVDLGSIQIGSKFRFNDWRDYAPYTKIECFVPCCGWCQLPPWCMGRTVTGTLYIDIANGSCKAVIKAGKTPVAEIGGCVAMDVPFSSVATGAKAAGIITAITNGAVSAFNPTPQNLISGSFGILSSLNANYTETKGVMGDGSNINGCTDFLIKVTRPASTDTGNGEITTKYKQEKGLPCAKTKTLASGQGFTQIMDANIDGEMTDREKQMIIDGFRHGIIL